MLTKSQPYLELIRSNIKLYPFQNYVKGLTDVFTKLLDNFETKNLIGKTFQKSNSSSNCRGRFM